MPAGLIFPRVIQYSHVIKENTNIITIIVSSHHMSNLSNTKTMKLIYNGLSEGIQKWEALNVEVLESDHTPKNEQFYSSFISRELNLSLEDKQYLVTHETKDFIISAAAGYDGSWDYRYDLVLWKQAKDHMLNIDSVIEVKAPNKNTLPIKKDAIKMAEFLNLVSEVQHCYIAVLVRGDKERRQQKLEDACDRASGAIDGEKSMQSDDFEIVAHEIKGHFKAASAGVICISRK